jgi:hypothetical protein
VDQAALNRNQDGLRPVLHREFVENAAHVNPRGIFGDPQPVGNLAVAAPVCE